MPGDEVTCVVPARLGSTRFPGKLLHPIFGKPVVVHALDRAREAECFASVLCLTDSPEIGAAVAEHGFRYAISGQAANGTERIGRNLEAVETDLIVNLQGDEPAFPAEGLRTLCRALRENPEWVHTLVHEDEPSEEDLENPYRVKALLDERGFVLDFVRKLEPPVAEWRLDTPAFGGHSATEALYRGPGGSIRVHSGAYAYSKNYLRRYTARNPSGREVETSHEMLRDPSLAPIRAHAAPSGAPVDRPGDLAAARARLEARLPQGAPS